MLLIYSFIFLIVTFQGLSFPRNIIHSKFPRKYSSILDSTSLHQFSRHHRSNYNLPLFAFLTNNISNQLNYKSLDEDSSNQSMKVTSPLKLSNKIKVRQHVNPLSEKYMKPLVLPKSWLQSANDDLNKLNHTNYLSQDLADVTVQSSHGIFKFPQNPIYVDIGSAKGTWAINMSQHYPQFNFLGLEIRRPCVDLSMQRKQSLNLTNVHFFPSNVNVDLKYILSELNANNVNIKQLSIQFPDPQFKKKHFKRKAVNDDLVNIITQFTKPSTKIFLQSDLEDITQEMMNNFLKFSNNYRPCTGYDVENLSMNKSPVSVKTEREIATENKNQSVYRILLERI